MDNQLQKLPAREASQLPVTDVDLMTPPDRFQAASRLYVRLHRQQLLLRQYWWVFLAIAGLAGGALLLITLAAPPAFESSARMWLTGRLDLSEGHLYTEELVNFLGTQADLLRSEAVENRALSRTAREFSEAHIQPLPGALQAVKGFVSPAAREKFLRTAFPFSLKITESPKSSILELHARGTEPKTTQAFLNALMTEYLAFKREVREEASDRAVASLARQVSGLADELKTQQERMYAFQMSNNVVFLQEQGSGAQNYLALLSRQLATLHTELDLLRAIEPEQWVELGQRTAAGQTESPPGDASAEQRLAGLQGPRNDLFQANQQVQMLKARRDELAKSLQPMHPKILKLDQDIAAQQRLAGVAREEIQRQLVNRREALQAEVGNLQKAFSEWDVKALQSSRKMVDYERLRQDVQRTQAAYDKLLSVISTVDVGKSVDQENVSVLEAASPALPVNNFIRNAALALALALLLGGGVFWLLGKFDDRFASSMELASDTPERVLGQIMEIRLGKPERQMRPEVLTTQRFEFLEAFRSIRSAIWFMGESGHRPRTMLITSSRPGEGKTTVALYLAATMAKAGSRVLLVDGDMRRAKLHRYFTVASSPGLAEILAEEQMPEHPVVATALPNLHFLPAGAASTEPGELVLGPAFGVFLRQLAPHYDHVLIDSPPVLAADDAAALAPGMDGVLFVVRGSYTSARMVRDALDALRQRHSRVLGLIFNRAVSSAFEYHPYQRYKNQYRWQPA